MGQTTMTVSPGRSGRQDGAAEGPGPLAACQRMLVPLMLERVGELAMMMLVVPAEALREIREAGGRGDWRAAACLLLTHTRAGKVTGDDLVECLSEVWVRNDPPAGPHGVLSDDEWIELFNVTGFFVGPPTTPFSVADRVCLFRAAPRERARGMSWCTHENMARGFVPRHDRFGRYQIWRADVPKSAILAALYRPGDAPFDLPPGEYREVVVNSAGLPDTLAVVSSAP